nr:nucleotidyltransferase family protein [uncultured Pedobacter sp.]
MNTGIIILAAGNSSRLGRPKQLLKYKGKTLLDLVTEEALKIPTIPTVVVLGAYSKEILNHHTYLGIAYIVNPNWQTGISSSIAAGMSAIGNQSKEIENVIIAVADQVFITSKVFEKLLQKRKLSSKGIIASSYAETVGTPVLFSKKYFEKLLSLTGNTGAKSIVQLNMEDTETIPFELGHIDIDTETDYNNLIKHQ